MTDNVVELGNITLQDIPPDRILQAAMGKLRYVLIVGVKESGERYLDSSSSDGAAAIAHCFRAMRMIDDTPL